MAARAHAASRKAQYRPPVTILWLIWRLGAEGLEAQRAGGLQEAHGVAGALLHIPACQRTTTILITARRHVEHMEEDVPETWLCTASGKRHY